LGRKPGRNAAHEGGIRKANRLIVISPMIDARARLVGERLGIEMFGDSVLVESLENT
jgi:hypothetical protein